MTATDVLNEEDQRKFQANAWNLSEDASWTEIYQAARDQGHGAVFFNIDDWEETMRRLYRPDLFD